MEYHPREISPHYYRYHYYNLRWTMSWTLEQPQPRKNPMLGKERKDPSIGVHIARAMLGWEKKKLAYRGLFNLIHAWLTKSSLRSTTVSATHAWSDNKMLLL
jgi:hypothetical protein